MNVMSGCIGSSALKKEEGVFLDLRGSFLQESRELGGGRWEEGGDGEEKVLTFWSLFFFFCLFSLSEPLSSCVCDSIHNSTPVCQQTPYVLVLSLSFKPR